MLMHITLFFIIIINIGSRQLEIQFGLETCRR